MEDVKSSLGTGAHWYIVFAVDPIPSARSYLRAHHPFAAADNTEYMHSRKLLLLRAGDRTSISVPVQYNTHHSTHPIAKDGYHSEQSTIMLLESMAKASHPLLACLGIRSVYVQYRVYVEPPTTTPTPHAYEVGAYGETKDDSSVASEASKVSSKGKEKLR